MATVWHITPNGPERCKASKRGCPYEAHLESNSVPSIDYYLASELTNDVPVMPHFQPTAGDTLDGYYDRVRNSAERYYNKYGRWPEGGDFLMSPPVYLYGVSSTPIKITFQEKALMSTMVGNNDRTHFDVEYLVLTPHSSVVSMSIKKNDYQEYHFRKAVADALPPNNTTDNAEGLHSYIQSYLETHTHNQISAFSPQISHDFAWSCGLIRPSQSYPDLAAYKINNDFCRVPFKDFIVYSGNRNLMVCESEAVFTSEGGNGMSLSSDRGGDYTARNDVAPGLSKKHKAYTAQRHSNGSWSVSVEGETYNIAHDSDMRQFALSRHDLYNSQRIAEFIDVVNSPAVRARDMSIYKRRMGMSGYSKDGVDGRPLSFYPLSSKDNLTYTPHDETGLMSKLRSFLRSSRGRN